MMKYTHTSSAPSLSLIITIAIATIILLQNPTNAETCGTGDDIACQNGGTCADGQKSYLELGIPNFTFLSKQKRGMHCTCPGEALREAGEAKSGMTGVHCDVPYEICSNGKVCFHGGTCVAEQFQSTEFHCQCPQDPKHDVWAGISCAIPAEDFCDEDEFYDITGGKWFCTQGGKCINGEKDLSKKCDCQNDTYGLHCEFSEEQECALQCDNGGKCKVGLKDFTQMAEYGLDIAEYLGGQELYGEHCVCPAGFSGVKCQTENVDRCGSSLCFNGAECVQTMSLDGKEVYNEFCRCKSGEDGAFAGKFCEHVATKFCPAPYGHSPDEYFCTNGGECPNNPHLPCKCVDEFTGPKCEIPPGGNKDNGFDCDLDCENGECFFGQSPVVDEELKALQDSGLDFLVDNKHCRCEKGFVGIRCEIEKRKTKCEDNEHFCLHGLECIPDSDQYTCDCRDAASLLTSYDGNFCDHRAAEFCQGLGANDQTFCSNHGGCWGNIGVGNDNVRCLCEEGWTGKYCELEALASSGVASRAFTSFLATLVGIGSFFGAILLLQRWRKRDRDIEYEKTYENEQVHSPYGGGDSDLSVDSDQDDYQFKDIVII